MPDKPKSNPKQTSCQQCNFCTWFEKDGINIQVGCKAGQLEKYKILKQRVDPNGHDINNSIFKLYEGGGTRYYIINLLCPFQRSESWVNDNVDPNWTKEELREHLISVTPFLYAAVVISDGDVKKTLRSCKSAINATVPPQFIKIVYPYRLKADRSKEDLFYKLEEKLSDGTFKHPGGNFNFEIRQIVDSVYDDLRLKIYDALKAAKGYFYVLVLQEDYRVTEDFVESIKKLVLNEFFDFHIISLNDTNAFMVAPVFLENAEFSPGAAYQWTKDGFKQEFNINHVRNFLNVVE